MSDDTYALQVVLRELIEEVRQLREAIQRPTWIPSVTGIPPVTITPFVIDQTNEIPCAHEQCTGCKNGTCNGVHMLVCYCRKCQPTYLTTATVTVKP